MFSFLRRFIGHRSPLRLGWHYAKAFCAAVQYGFPARKLTIIGITGTDGKTTTVGMVGHILHQAGVSVGTISTTQFRIQGTMELNTSQKTSVSPFALQALLRRMVNEGCTHVVVEVSSHGLVQGRVHHIYPQVAAITNTSQEHLDYHRTMAQYRRDKGKLFAMLQGKGTKILNRSDETYELYRSIPSNETITYSTQDDDVWVTNAQAHPDACQGTVHIDGAEYLLRLAVPGLFNLFNAQCSIACCMALDVSVEQAVEALASYNGEFGRMQKIDEGQSFHVYADYTVSPAAYEHILQTMRTMVEPGKRVLVLTGSCGDRMEEKRPVIGSICSEYADVVVVTMDESYKEPYEKVMDDVIAGVDTSACTLHRIVDRREAIEFILQEAQPGDCVAFCGMAGVTTMMTHEGQIPWDEVEIIREELQGLKMKS